MVRNGKSFHLHSPMSSDSSENCKNCFSLGSLRTPLVTIPGWPLAWSQRNYDIMEGSSQRMKSPSRTTEMVSLFGKKRKAWIIYSVEFLQHTTDWPSLFGSLGLETLPLSLLLTNLCHKFLSVVRLHSNSTSFKCKNVVGASAPIISKQWINPPHCYLIVETLSQDAKIKLRNRYIYTFTHT